MEDLIKKIIAFRNQRDWEKHHTPENLAKSIVIEAAELLEHFQWSNTPHDLKGVEEELADVLIYCFLLLEHYQFDLETIIKSKIEKNKIKYPIKEGE